MLRFETATGSVYEADLINKKIRRLSGINNPTHRLGKDEEFRSYSYLGSIEVNLPAQIIWPHETPLIKETTILLPEADVDGFMKMTMTSKVVKVTEDV